MTPRKGMVRAKQPRNSWPNEAAGPDGRALASPALFFFPLTMPEVSLESFACLLGFLSCLFFSRLVITFLSDFRPCFCGTQSGIWTKKTAGVDDGQDKKKVRTRAERRRNETKKTMGVNPSANVGKNKQTSKPCCCYSGLLNCLLG